MMTFFSTINSRAETTEWSVGVEHTQNVTALWELSMAPGDLRTDRSYIRNDNRCTLMV